MFAIHVENLVKNYGVRRVLDGLNLDLSEGEFYALMGPNGSGKTTLASIIAGVKTPTSGVVEIYGKKPAEAKSLIGYVPQENFSSPKLSGRENLTYFATILGYPREQRNQLVTEILKNVGLSEESNKRVATYSGGMRKRLEVATALFPGIKVLILDEPTTGLDPAARRSFFSTLREIVDNKTTILLITHIGSDAELASRVGLIDAGKIIAEGTPEELKKKHAAEDVVTVEIAESSDRVLPILKDFSLNGSVAQLSNGYRIYVRNGDMVLPEVIRALSQAGHKVMRVEMARTTLEDVFFKLTEKSIQETPTN